MINYEVINKNHEEKEGVVISAKEFGKMNNLIPIEVEENAVIKLRTATINRPGLILAEETQDFGLTRVQVIGSAEVEYLNLFDEQRQHEMLARLFSKDIPCVIFTRGIIPTDFVIAMAKYYKIPLYRSNNVTGILMDSLYRNIDKLLAQEITMHGVMVEVAGVGMFITGNSGIGKSETALELIHRGHKLIADDAVVFKKVRNEIIASSPETIRNLMELRGVGIINVSTLFGVGAVLEETKLEYVVQLENWDDNKEYSRISMAEDRYTILDREIPFSIIPIMPGRNLAIILEVAARNFRAR